MPLARSLAGAGIGGHSSERLTWIQIPEVLRCPCLRSHRTAALAEDRKTISWSRTAFLVRANHGGFPDPMFDRDANAQTHVTGPMLSVSNLTVHFESRPAIADVCLDIAAGETVSLLGPNGAGKSTLLKVIAGMLPASHGSVRFRGAPLRGVNDAITYVPQRAGADWAFPISVREAVQLGLPRTIPRWRRFSRDERERARAALAQVGMDTLGDVQIGALSGGQQQRVFLARALLDRGSILLLDEPFTGVDVPTQELFVSLFDELRAQGRTIIYATHDLAQAARTSDRVVLLNRRVIASGPPANVLNDATLGEAFGGRVLVLTGPNPEATGDEAARATAGAAAGAAAGNLTESRRPTTVLR